MKRMYIGLGLLLGILLLGILLTAVFCRLHTPLAAVLEQAQAAAQAEDWEKATALATQARADWDQFRDFTAAFADHEPLEQMDALFARLEVLAALREADEFSADCAQLSRLAAAMADSQRITWWNLL